MLKQIFTSQRQFIEYFFDHVDIDEAESVLGKFLSCKGMIVFTGVGKSGIIADKLAKTMISTGSRSLYLPPASALHGDIGMLGSEDLVVMLSKSGGTNELLEFAEIVRRRKIETMAWVSGKDTPLSKIVDSVVHLPLTSEICPFGLAPTTSTAVQLIYGDVMAVALMRAKNFSIDDYAMNHPGGAIGKLIAQRVSEIMVTGDELPLCRREDLLKDVLVELTKKRLGCLLIVDEGMRLEGVFTDGDLRRAIGELQEKALTLPMSQLLTKPFLYTTPSTLTSKALDQMEGVKKVMMLPVLEEERLVGLVHLHHILSPRSLKIVQ